jgi:hypothetical protein
VARLYLIVFAARHVTGVAVFVWLMILSFHLHSAPLGWLFVVTTPVYAGIAFVSLRKLLIGYRRSQRYAAERSLAPPAPARSGR